MDRHPHPNAAQSLHQLVSFTGRADRVSQANRDELRVNSLREDLPPDMVPPTAARRKDRDYLLINRPEWMDFTPIQKLLEDIRKGK